jgi:peptidoglycan/LPS O-acetylase OafA/YrhL
MGQVILLPNSGTTPVVLSRRRIPALDGLRGAAVVLVLLYHSTTGVTAGKGIFVEAFGRILAAGWVGVDIFFALSGFLITGILLDTCTDPLYFRKFYVRRFLRIFPLYYGVLLVILLLTPMLHLDWHATIPDFLLFWQNYVAYWRLTITGSAINLHLEHLWSLAVEEQFYLVWPFLVWILRGRRSFVYVPAFLLIACPIARILALHMGVSGQTTYLWAPFRVDSLAWGAMAALVQRGLFARSREHLALASVLIGATTICGLFVKNHGSFEQFNPSVVQIGYSALGLFSFGILLCLLQQSSPIVSFFSFSPLRWLGSLSFGIYV